jgi:hypothetical protein
VLLADDVHAQFDALVADENRRPRDEFMDLMLAFAAERAVKKFFVAGFVSHCSFLPP